MYVMRIDRPKESLDYYQPKGTTITLELTYSEMILLEHALNDRIENGKLKSDDEMFFYWQFHSIRELLKFGNLTSFVVEHFNALFRKDKSEEDGKEAENAE